jgi:hypothetical protein
MSLCLLPVSEAAAAAEDVKKLTSEVTRLMAELDSVQDQLSAVKVTTPQNAVPPTCMTAWVELIKLWDLACRWQHDAACSLLQCCPVALPHNERP